MAVPDAGLCCPCSSGGVLSGCILGLSSTAQSQCCLWHVASGSPNVTVCWTGLLSASHTPVLPWVLLQVPCILSVRVAAGQWGPATAEHRSCSKRHTAQVQFQRLRWWSLWGCRCRPRWCPPRSRVIARTDMLTLWGPRKTNWYCKIPMCLTKP